MRRLLFVLVGVTLAVGPAWAQTAPGTEQTELIKNLLERLEKLEKRLAELEARPTEAPVAASLAPGGENSVAPGNGDGVASAAPQEPPAAAVEGPYPSLKLAGFTDLVFSATNQPGSFSGFNLGQFILHATSPLSRKITYFGEVSFTARRDSFALEVERSIIRYDYNDSFKLSFGRYHTPVNYWNTAFHHGLWLQTTISRPEMIQFGGRFLPVHFIGVLAEGNLPSGGLGLGYNVGVGNGRGSIISRGGDAGDTNNNRAWLVNVFARPGQLYPLQVGGSIYRDKVSPGVGANFREWIASAHLIWSREDPEFLSEYALVRQRNTLTGAVFNSQAFYVQLAYRLPWGEKRWKPYYRFEYINVPESEPVLGVPDLEGSTLGLRYDISDWAAFKGEYRNSKRRDLDPRVHGLFLQTAFTF